MVKIRRESIGVWFPPGADIFMDSKTKNPLLKKLRGYQKAPRDRFKLLTDKILTQEEFLLYELTIAITDWDRTHETYGTFQATNRQLAEILGWKRDSTASRHKKNLLKKGWLSREEDGSIKPTFFQDWELRRTLPANKQSIFAQMQSDLANKQDELAKKHEFYSHNKPDPLVSYQGKSSYSEYVENKDLPPHFKKYTSDDLIASFEAAEARGEV